MKRAAFVDTAMEPVTSVEELEAIAQEPAHFDVVSVCALCGSKERQLLFDQKPCALYRCEECGLVFLNPRLKPDVLMRFYNGLCWSSPSPKDCGYADYRRDAPLYLETFRKRYRLVERFLRTPGRALDVGCAAGYFMQVLREHGWEVAGVEPAGVIVEFARQRYGFDAIHESVIETAPFEEGSFDLVSLWDVVEHVPEPVPFMRQVVRFLADDGVLVLETQNIASLFARLLGSRWHHFKNLEHLYHFDPSTLRRLFGEVGLDVVHMTPRFGGKHVSLEFIRERATRLSPVMRYALLPLAPLNDVHFYVNVMDEIVVVAKKRPG